MSRFHTALSWGKRSSWGSNEDESGDLREQADKRTDFSEELKIKKSGRWKPAVWLGSCKARWPEVDDRSPKNTICSDLASSTSMSRTLCNLPFTLRCYIKITMLELPAISKQTTKKSRIVPISWRLFKSKHHQKYLHNSQISRDSADS